MSTSTLPALPYDNWADTRDTLHLFLQIIGKIRLKAHPKLHHWWHVTLYPGVRGLTTGRVPYSDDGFEIEFDMVDHRVIVTRGDGRRVSFDVAGRTVAGFYTQVKSSLTELDIAVDIHAVPYENKSTVPFAQDDAPRAYDKDAVTRYFQVLGWTASMFEVFRGRFTGKQTPVQLFWHSFDLVVTRFSGRAHPLTGGTASDREAYSHEVISIGFWPGDDSFPQAAFYGYAYPEPDGLAQSDLKPATAKWTEKNGGALAILTYDDLRDASDPAAALLAFLQSVYEGAGVRADWPLDALAHRQAET